MLLKFVYIISSLHSLVLCAEKITKNVKPYYQFPIPFEMPNRNDRADQCWLRIEDVELVETVTVYCTIAHRFLDSYIRDYNSKKMDEDGVDVSLWYEKPKSPTADSLLPDTNQHAIQDWRTTTVMDPVTHMRIYVTKNADCRLVMYTREGMSNYLVDCERILYHVNVRMSASVVFSRQQNLRLLLASIFLVYLFM